MTCLQGADEELAPTPGLAPVLGMSRSGLSEQRGEPARSPHPRAVISRFPHVRESERGPRPGSGSGRRARQPRGCRGCSGPGHPGFTAGDRSEPGRLSKDLHSKSACGDTWKGSYR